MTAQSGRSPRGARPLMHDLHRPGNPGGEHGGSPRGPKASVSLSPSHTRKPSVPVSAQTRPFGRDFKPWPDAVSDEDRISAIPGGLPIATDPTGPRSIALNQTEWHEIKRDLFCCVGLQSDPLPRRARSGSAVHVGSHG